MKAQNESLKSGVVKIGFVLILLVITSYRSKEDSKKDTIPVSSDELKINQFKFNPGPVIVNVALRRIILKVDKIQ